MFFHPLGVASTTGRDPQHLLREFSSMKKKLISCIYNKKAFGPHILCKDAVRVPLDSLIPALLQRSTKYVQLSVLS